MRITRIEHQREVMTSCNRISIDFLVSEHDLFMHKNFYDQLLKFIREGKEIDRNFFIQLAMMLKMEDDE